VPRTTIVEIAPAEQARLRAELRRARYGDLLALPLLLRALQAGRQAKWPPSSFVHAPACTG
jgi:hypothetical protein